MWLNEAALTRSSVRSSGAVLDSGEHYEMVIEKAELTIKCLDLGELIASNLSIVSACRFLSSDLLF